MLSTPTRAAVAAYHVITRLFRHQTRHVASAALRNTKKEGDISSVFSSLSGGDVIPLDPRFGELKRRLIEGHEKELEDSWKRLLRRLAVENDLIAQKGSSVVPQIDFADIQSRLEDFEDEVKLRGVAVIKGVVPRDEARAYKMQIEDYVKANPGTRAFPQHAPAVFELYWSRAQVRARSHPNLTMAQKYLMSLWHSTDPSAPISTSHPVAYADRVRIRQPGDAGFALGPHVDGGSVERWEPTGYGAGGVYDQIFRGRWEDYDPWETSGRVAAVTELYESAGGCSMYRMFQGWLSMSATGPGQGTLLVNPLLKLSTAYMMLRPFFQPLRSPPRVETSDSSSGGDLDLAAYLDESNWVLEPSPTPLLHGASPGLGQELTPTFHPHLRLDGSSMVPIPAIQPGDFVVWHCDTVHAVDRVHRGTTDSSVLYIPVCPLTEANIEYLVRQREAFLHGEPGPDFPGGKGESAHVGRAGVGDLGGEGGERAMGFAKFEGELDGGEGEREMVEKANRMLGFA